MNRLFAIAPVALLTTACAVRTPATALDARGELSPETRAMVLPSDTEAITSWQLPPASIWSRYEKLTLLTYLADTPVTATMPDVAGLDDGAAGRSSRPSGSRRWACSPTRCGWSICAALPRWRSARR